jgi:phosphomannomutase
LDCRDVPVPFFNTLLGGPVIGETIYCCPGEEYPIERAVHLGRLAASYPACAGCPRRTDTATISPRHVQRLAGFAREHAAAGSRFHREGISGVYLNEIDATVAKRIGRALGMFLNPADQTAAQPNDAHSVVVAGDGSAAAAELVAAAADGLHWSGCRTIDVGVGTAASLLMAREQHGADGALLVGNSDGRLGHIGFTVWGRRGIPCSAGGGLDVVQQGFETALAPLARSFGAAERASADESYLNWLAEFYHAMRPLRIVIETCSPVLIDDLNRLTSRVAVELIWQKPSVETSDRRLERIGKRVWHCGAHFGVWIDGNGEALRLVDEQAAPIDTTAILRALAGEATAAGKAATIVATRQTDQPQAASIDSRAPRFIHCGPTREAVFTAMSQHSADLAGDDAGRIWLAPHFAAADALHVVTLLVVILSRADLPLSRVIASVIL